MTDYARPVTHDPACIGWPRAACLSVRGRPAGADFTRCVEAGRDASGAISGSAEVTVPTLGTGIDWRGP